MQKITLIAAMAENHVIGVNNSIPWHIAEDFAFFKQYTTNKPIIMGRKTWDSLPHKPLPNRKNMVLSFEQDQLDGAEVFTDIQTALNAYANSPEIVIIGGEQIYRLLLPFATDLRLTEIHFSLVGDAFFPEFSLTDWQEISREPHQNTDGVKFDFVHYSRR